MFKSESDPGQEEAPEESQQPRMNMDVSQWLVVKFEEEESLFVRHVITPEICPLHLTHQKLHILSIHIQTHTS